MAPIEIVANRIIWSLLFLIILLACTRSIRKTLVDARSARTVGFLAIAAVLLAINWGTYVYAIETDHVVEASLGYFINPLVSVALGIVFLRERLRSGQWLAVGVAVAAVLVLTIAYGHPPWISLILAFSFGFYGLFKKQVGIGSAQSLTIETAVLLPVALGITAWLGLTGQSAWLTQGASTWILLVLLGPVTAIPLLAFGGAATRIPLSTLGIVQYITPVLQFIVAIAIFREPMSAGTWIGFVLVWTSLVIMTVDGLRHTRNRADDLEVIEPD